ncbi:AMSH-like ubiquitin thioesterase 2 isoform X4 [Rhododendron vialii]|uniref:AMSH-like ubiquitin thioesterase 2 isoform X4 n=1 Tax=Rhododendron vialii TaxID=182163 RepID=UPI00265D9BBF|nr:AMSH-like ubiquitin thioesterase 2 isoform X4 [Rhododendron vialii]
MAASYFSQIGVHTVTQSSPSPTISCVYNAPHIAEVSRITSADSVHGHSSSSSDGLTASRVLKDVHISARLMDDFLALARDNTDKDLETCGVLGAFLRGGIFHVTTLIIPKQESTSSSALYEEEIFSIQHEQSLFPVGWIHTHPSQSCFMSSVDLHTQFSYQVEKERIVLGRKQIGAHGKTCWTWKEFAAHGNDQSVINLSNLLRHEIRHTTVKKHIRFWGLFKYREKRGRQMTCY